LFSIASPRQILHRYNMQFLENNVKHTFPNMYVLLYYFINVDPWLEVSQPYKLGDGLLDIMFHRISKACGFGIKKLSEKDSLVIPI